MSHPLRERVPIGLYPLRGQQARGRRRQLLIVQSQKKD